MARVAEPISEHEAANIDRLSSYAFTYGTLLALANLGLPELVTTAGLPPYGNVGAPDLFSPRRLVQCHGI